MNIPWVRLQLTHDQERIGARNTKIDQLERKMLALAGEARSLSASLATVAADAEEFVRRMREQSE